VQPLTNRKEKKMAVLKGNVLGDISGKLGKLAARIIRGRTILAQRPVDFHVSYVPVLVEIRKKFAVTGNFVKNLITHSVLYEIWSKAKDADMSVFNYAFKLNFTESGTDKPTVDNLLTPAGGFPLPVTTATVSATDVSIVTAALNTVTETIDDTVERDLIANGLICYYNPVNADDAPFVITPIASAKQSVDLVNPLTFTLPINIDQQLLAAKYQNSILFAAIATLDINETVHHYSSTFAQND
jgi:hypothetical protein